MCVSLGQYYLLSGGGGGSEGGGVKMEEETHSMIEFPISVYLAGQTCWERNPQGGKQRIR